LEFPKGDKRRNTQKLMSTSTPQSPETSQRQDDLRATLAAFDEFMAKAPLKDIADELNARMGIYRSELQTRESISKSRAAAGLPPI